MIKRLWVQCPVRAIFFNFALFCQCQRASTRIWQKMMNYRKTQCTRILRTFSKLHTTTSLFCQISSHFVSVNSQQHLRSSCFIFDFLKFNFHKHNFLSQLFHLCIWTDIILLPLYVVYNIFIVFQSYRYLFVS